METYSMYSIQFISLPLVVFCNCFLQFSYCWTSAVKRRGSRCDDHFTCFSIHPILLLVCDIKWFYFPAIPLFTVSGRLLLDMSFQVDLRHVQQTEGSPEVLEGIDMSEFYKSVEWDILLVPVKYNEEFYECCPGEPYPDLTFNITMRRKTLFYTVNLVSGSHCLIEFPLIFLPSFSPVLLVLSSNNRSLLQTLLYF